MYDVYNTVTGDINLICGIYIIVNKKNGKTYVGQSINSVYSRSRAHRIDTNNELGYSIRENGFSMFDLFLYPIDKNYLDLNEAIFIKELDCIYPNGYNSDSGGQTNKRRSSLTRKKISEGNKGNVRTAESIAKTNAANTGSKRSWESMKKMSISMKGIKKGPMSEDHKRKIKEKCDERKVKRLLANNERKRKMDIEHSKRQVGYTPLNTNKGAHYE